MTEKDLLSVYQALQPMLDREIDERTRSALRLKSMVVTTAYDAGTQTVGVTEAFGGEMFLPVFGGLDTTLLVKGAPVWVMMPYSSLSNAVVFAMGDMTGIGGGGSGTTYTFDSGTTNGAFSVTPSDTGVAQSVAIYGLGSAAYTDSTDYASASSVTHIGEYHSNTQSSGVNMANYANATICSVTGLSAGTYFAEGTIRYPGNASGYRVARLTTNSSQSYNYDYDGVAELPAVNTNYMTLHTSYVFVLNNSGGIYLRGYHNAGTTLNGVLGTLHCVRIK